MNKIAIGGIIAAVLLLVVGVGYTLGNFAGRPVQTVNGRIDDVDYRPRHQCGTKTVGETTRTTKDSNGHSRTVKSGGHTEPKWCDASWKIEIAYQGRYEYQTRSTRPPSWLREGAQVRVRYVTGRWNRAVMFVGVDRG